MKLYRVGGSRSNRVQWMLEELGVTVELQTLDFRKGELRSEAHLLRHPHGLVPAFEDEGLSLIESSAICLYLADKYPDKKLAPAVGTKERAKYYQWCVYAPATLDEKTVAAFFHTVVYPADQRDPKVVERARELWGHAANVLEPVVAHSPYLLGEFSAADVVVGYAVTLAARIGLLEGHAVLAAYAKRLSERPAFARAYAG